MLKRNDKSFTDDKIPSHKKYTCCIFELGSWPDTASARGHCDVPRKFMMGICENEEFFLSKKKNTAELATATATYETHKVGWFDSITYTFSIADFHH